ncbi:transglycosylase [Pleosporales sp. CAS-2024a]
MRSTLRALVVLASAALITPSVAQTYTSCNPTLGSNCPPDSALGKTVNIDFSAASDSFTAQGNPTYSKNGASFTIAKSGDAPQLTSKWYIMFGKVEIAMQAAPGAGIVSSFVLQSDDLDEIDWEWLGGDPDEAQSNYFYQGKVLISLLIDTTTYDRGAFHADSGSQSGFKTYTIEWTPRQIVWQINGVTVRVLESSSANGAFPQTPARVKLGAWSGGDPANSPGTIQWARGPTDYSKGPYSMVVRSLMVQDYSTGTQYLYGDQSGTWQSIKSVGGSIYSGGSQSVANAPAVTAVASGQPIPFTPTKTDTTRPSVYPWVPGKTSAAPPQSAFSNYPGLPSGWTVSDSGKVIPPSSAPVSKPLIAPMLFLSQAASSMPWPAPSPWALPGDSNPNVVTTSYNDAKGLTTLKTLYPSTTTSTRTAGPSLHSNAGQTNIPLAPMAGSSGTRLLGGIPLQLMVMFSGLFWVYAL